MAGIEGDAAEGQGGTPFEMGVVELQSGMVAGQRVGHGIAPSAAAGEAQLGIFNGRSGLADGGGLGRGLG